MSIHEQARAAVLEADEYMANHRVTDSWRVISRLHGTLVRLMDQAATRTRVVTTVTELDALPVGSVVRCDDAEGIGMNVAEKQAAGWVYVGSSLEFPSGVLASDKVPFRVLYDPEETR